MVELSQLSFRSLTGTDSAALALLLYRWNRIAPGILAHLCSARKGTAFLPSSKALADVAVVNKASAFSECQSVACLAWTARLGLIEEKREHNMSK